jgi:TPR repeat protein
MESSKWYLLAAQNGHTTSQVAVGRCYNLGIGFPVDLVESLKWFRLAAEKGDSEAQYSIGIAYSVENRTDWNVPLTRRLSNGGNWPQIRDTWKHNTIVPAG